MPRCARRVPRKPSAASLARLDVLLFDIQDVGSRTYTYISTLGEALRAAAEAGVKVIVLDRPNPLGGVRFEGPIREEAHASFVGCHHFALLEQVDVLGRAAPGATLLLNCRHAPDDVWDALPRGHKFTPPEVLFKKIEDEQVAELAARFGGGGA